MMAGAMRHVRQTYASSCGPACVAMVADVSEKKAIRVIFGWNKKRGHSTDWPDLKPALHLLGVAPSQKAKRVSTWTKIPWLAIVALGRSKPPIGPKLHFVVYDPATNLVFDPSRKGPVAPDRIRRLLVSYLAIGAEEGQ